MKTKTKVWLTIAVAFIFGGLALAGIGVAFGATTNFSYYFSNGSFHFSKGSQDTVYNTVAIEDFSKLTVSSNVVDIRIVENSDKNCIIYSVPERYVPEITGTDNLVITVPEANVDIFNFLEFNTDESPYILINIHDSGRDREFDINNSTGDIYIENTAFHGNINSSTGDIHINSATCGDLKLETSSGDISMNSTTANELKVQVSTGETYYNDCTFDKMTLRSSTGDVEISSSTVGSVTLNGSTSDFKINDSSVKDIKVDVSTGECKLELNASEDDYSCQLSTSTGDIKYGHNEYEKQYSRDGNGNGSIAIHTSTGDISIRFSR